MAFVLIVECGDKRFGKECGMIDLEIVFGRGFEVVFEASDVRS